MAIFSRYEEFYVVFYQICYIQYILKSCMFCSDVIFIYLCCCMNVLTHLPGLQHLILYLPLIHSLVRHSTTHWKCWFMGVCMVYVSRSLCACAWGHIQMHGEAKSWYWISCSFSHCFVSHSLSQVLELTNSARLAGQKAGLLLSLPPQHWDYKHMAFYMAAELAVQPSPWSFSFDLLCFHF